MEPDQHAAHGGRDHPGGRSVSRLEEAITRLAIAVEQLTLATLDRPVPTGRVLEAPTLVPAPVQPAGFVVG